MGIFDKLFGKKKEEDEFRDELWNASPQSVCGVCGKQLRGLSGGVVTGSGADFMRTMLEGARYACPNCGFVSCFECCANMETYKVVCKQCQSEMSRA